MLVPKASISAQLAEIRLNADDLLRPGEDDDWLEKMVVDTLATARVRGEVSRQPGTPIVRDPGGAWLNLAVPSAASTRRVGPRRAVPAPGPKTWLTFDPSNSALRLRRAPTRDYLRCLEHLAQGEWSPAAYIDAKSQYSSDAFDMACVRAPLDVVWLRQELPRGSIQRDRLLPILALQLAHLNEEMLRLSVKNDGDGFAGSLAAHAARGLDAQALKEVFAALSASNTSHSDSVPIVNIYAWAAACVESDGWTLLPQEGVATLEALLQCIKQTTQDSPPAMANSWRDGIVRILIKSRRLEALPLVAHVDAQMRAQSPLEHRTYLRWAAHDGWAEGIEKLVELGLDVNARLPVPTVGHESFSVGLTPLMAVLTSKAMSDAVSVQVAAKLVERGAQADAWAQRGAGSNGKAIMDVFSVRDYTHRAGFERRWNLLIAQIPECIETQENRNVEQFFAAINELMDVAEKILQGQVEDAVVAEATLKSLHRAHEAYYSASKPRAILDGKIGHFIMHSSLLFGDAPMAWGPYFLRNDAAHLPSIIEFYGHNYGMDSTSLRLRLQAWATQLYALFNARLSRAEISPAQAPELSKPSHWLAQLARAVKGEPVPISGIELALEVLRGQPEVAMGMLRAQIHPTAMQLGLAFWVAIDRCRNLTASAAPHDPAIKLAQALIARCTTPKAVRALIEIALAMGSPRWVGAVLEHTNAHSVRLDADDVVGDETLLHVAAEASQDALKALCKGVPKALRQRWLGHGDDVGETPLHRAARTGLKPITLLLQGFESEQTRAFANIENTAGLTPAMVALQFDQPATFAYLARLASGLRSGDALLQALSTRRGVVTSELLASLMQAPNTATLIRTHAATLGRRLARLGDTSSLEALFEHMSAQLLALHAGHSSLLHAAAQSSEPQVLALLQAHASPGQLRVMAEHKDSHKKRAEDYARDSAAIAAFRALRPELEVAPSLFTRGIRLASSMLPPMPQILQAPQAVAKVDVQQSLRMAAQQVARQNTSEALERHVKAFCAAAREAIEATTDAGEIAQVQQAAWHVIDHIDRAPIGIQARMGAHLALHRPEVPLEALAARALTTQSGASRFALNGGLALLQGRTQALHQARQMDLRPGMRAVIEVACPGLAASGYRNIRGEAQLFEQADTLRAIVKMTHHGLILVTTYAV